MENYKILNILGRGAEGTTYRALDLTKGREVAIKVVKISSSNIKDIYNREIKALEILSNDPLCSKYVPCLYNHFMTDKGLWIVMQLIQGKSLDKVQSRLEKDIQKNENFNSDLRWIIIGRLLESYAYIHSRGIEHRDISPYNIMWTGENIVFIDFGLACNFLTNDCAQSKLGKFPDLVYLINLIDEIASVTIRDAYSDKNENEKYTRYLKIWDPERARRISLITSNHDETNLDNIIQKYNGSM